MIECVNLSPVTVAEVVAASEPSSVLTSWTGTLLRALDERGVDVAAILTDIGLDEDPRSDPERRIPLGRVDPVVGDRGGGHRR